MKKIRNYILPFVAILFVLVSCNDTFEFHEKYIKDGETIYAPKVDSLQTLPGNGRIKIAGYLTKAFTVKDITVFWNNGENSQTFDYTKSQNDTDPIELIIESLEEKSYQFDVFSKDAEGNQSIKVTVFGNVYGETYRSNLEARNVGEASFDGNDAELNFGVSGDEFQRDTEIKYTNKNDEEVIVILGADESVATLTNVSSDVPVMYRTFYVPTLADEDGNETSIDVFPSDWKSVELVLTGSINYGKSDWVITDFSSEEAGGEGPTNGYATAAIDGDINTFWHSNWSSTAPGYPHYLTFDMGIEKTIAGFEVFRRQGDSRGQTKHKFYVSLDGTNWTDLGEYDMDPTTNAGQVYMVAPVEARYVKYEATQGPNFYAFLAEINVIESFDKTTWAITDFSSEEPAEANWSSYDYQGKAEAAIDGILETFWHSDWANQAPDYPHYFAFDMGAEKTVTSFEVYRRQGNGNGQTKHKFYVSLDGTTWTDLGEYAMDASINDGQSFDVTDTKARYIKYEATEGPNHYAFLAEMNVLGY